MQLIEFFTDSIDDFVDMLWIGDYDYHVVYIAEEFGIPFITRENLASKSTRYRLA